VRNFEYFFELLAHWIDYDEERQDEMDSHEDVGKHHEGPAAQGQYHICLHFLAVH